MFNIKTKKSTPAKYYWKVTPRVNIILTFMGMLGLGFILGLNHFTDSVGFGYIAAGLILITGFRWDFIETSLDEVEQLEGTRNVKKHNRR
jgi:hypothetical protein